MYIIAIYSNLFLLYGEVLVVQKMMKIFHKRESGFTLVELMVVVVIIAVLVAIAIPIYQGIQRTAAESAHDANVRTLKGAASVWFAEHGPTGVAQLTGDPGVLANNGVTYNGNGNGIENSDFGNYLDGGMPEVPGMVAGDNGISWDNLESDQPYYYVHITSEGQITVEPDIGAYDS